jgi:hypothetical protein
MNPTWQDLAAGWGERTELQIPRFARDDNPQQEDEGVEDKQGTTEVTLRSKTTKTAAGD